MMLGQVFAVVTHPTNSKLKITMNKRKTLFSYQIQSHQLKEFSQDNIRSSDTCDAPRIANQSEGDCMVAAVLSSI